MQIETDTQSLYVLQDQRGVTKGIDFKGRIKIKIQPNIINCVLLRAPKRKKKIV